MLAHKSIDWNVDVYAFLRWCQGIFDGYDKQDRSKHTLRRTSWPDFPPSIQGLESSTLKLNSGISSAIAIHPDSNDLLRIVKF